MSGDARDFINIDTRAFITVFSYKASAEGNTHHFEINITGICTILFHRQNLGSQV
jgi:hypothetical protein